MKNRTSKDWATTIMEDLDELKMNISIEDIKKVKKGIIMKTLSSHINQLIKSVKQESHSKVNNCSRSMLKMQNT